jgi:hypothetical protein
METKPTLFQIANLDQLLLCSIAATLNLNPSKNSTALSRIFNQHNPIYCASHSTQIVGEPRSKGDEIMLEFYNNMFISEIREIEGEKYTAIHENQL